MAGVLLCLAMPPGTAPAQVTSQDGLGYSGGITASPLGDIVAMTANTSWPGSINLGVFGFRSGVFDGTSIWLSPVHADQIVRVDPGSGSMSGFALPDVGTTAQKFAGAVFDGSGAWLVPFDANAVVRVAVANGSTSRFDAWPEGFVKPTAAFAGGVFDGTHVWLVPHNADRVVRVNPADGTMTGFSAWPAGFTKGPQAFWGGVFDGTYVWMIPFDADRVVRLDPASGTMTGFDTWPAGFGKGAGAFAGGTFDGQTIWLAPYDAAAIVAIDRTTGTMSLFAGWPVGFSKGAEAFAGAVFDGEEVWFVPFSADRLVKIDPATGMMESFDNWPAGVTGGATKKFVGAVFDGSSITLVAAETHALVKLQRNLDARLVNLSTRAVSLGGDRVIIPGFVIQGSGTKRVLVRAVGPKLQDFGIADFLPDPVLSIFREVEGRPLVASNDNWTDQESGRPDPAEVGDQVGAFALTPDPDYPTDDTLSAALVLDLEAGPYSTVARDVLDRTGIGIVEVYDVDGSAGASSRLINVSNRGFVGTDLQAMVPGFVVEGTGARRYLIRAVGPKLVDFGLPADSLLADPKLSVMRVDVEVAANDDWGSQTGESSATPEEVEAITLSVGAFPLGADAELPTSDEKSASLVVWLQPGVYTVVVSGASGGTGIAIAEVYEVD